MSNGEGYIDCNRDGLIRDIDGNPLQNDNNSATAQTRNDEHTLESYWRVLLYVPNLMGYLRVFLAFCGYQTAMQKQHNRALNMWISASVLDMFDGMAARRLNQCSQFGVVLDVIADNILRSIVWISIIVMIEEEHGDVSGIKRCIWTAIIFLEWITMFCSQMKASGRQHNHWKDMTQIQPPFWVQAVFKNNFHTLPGILAIYGLFIAPIGTYVMYADYVWPKQLLPEHAVSILVAISYVGRVLSASVELWICFDYSYDMIIMERNGQHEKQS
jgi:phosphatidylglycerophosphate synthase